MALNKESLVNIRNYTIPDSGALKLDYVTYKVKHASAHVLSTCHRSTTQAKHLALHAYIHTRPPPPLLNHCPSVPPPLPAELAPPLCHPPPCQ